MTPVRKQRLIVATLILLAAGVAGTLVALALQSNVTYLHTPSEVKAGTAPPATFRLGGVVTEGSVQRTEGTLDVRFSVTDRVNTVPVLYSGILPDLFREGQSVIARGQLREGTFHAEEILAKHDETYMPPEVKAAMEKAKAEGRAAPHAPQGTGG
jgi:cytochrome c-type biogenesis protein CcmE